jgi:hypothetical protein
VEAYQEYDAGWINFMIANDIKRNQREFVRPKPWWRLW